MACKRAVDGAHCEEVYIPIGVHGTIMRLLAVLLSSFAILHLPRFVHPLGSIGFALMLAVSASPRLSFSAQPNFLLVMADDMGFSDLGCYGSEIETPNLDKLAAGGLRFSQFYNTAKCHSSRVSLLSGRWSRQAGDESLQRAVILLCLRQRRLSLPSRRCHAQHRAL
jgi:hypothetical protein